MKIEDGEFKPITPYLGMGKPAPRHWQAFADSAALIMVGLTSVGKTTTFEALEKLGLTFTLLPDRRDMTDHLIINPILAMEGKTPSKMSRVERYPFMLRYREMYQGGMGHALTRLWFDPAQVAPLMIFNGLRGENETRYAMEALPQARFVALVAPAFVRLQRMLNRNDPHDRIKADISYSTYSKEVKSFADLEVAEASKFFNKDEEHALIEMVQKGAVSVKDLQDKLKIMVIDQQSYDSDGSAILQDLAPQRTLVIDTTKPAPDAVARSIIANFKLLMD